MKVSVIIPTYNEEKVIGKCLDSLSKQSFKDLEVIVIDDGSSDKTLDVLSNYQFSNFNFQILKQEHKGPGSARNLGAKKAKGKILVFVDSDMTFDTNFIKELIDPIIKGKSRGTFSKAEYVSNWDNIWARCWNINQGLGGKKRLPEDYPDYQKVFRALLKSEFDRVCGFDEGGHYTDDYLSDKLGYEAEVVSGAKFYHENPDNLKEVFSQAKWSAKRGYKLGIVGIAYSLLRTSLPVSIVVGLVKAIFKATPAFILFKVVYDLGAFIGIIEYALKLNSTK